MKSWASFWKRRSRLVNRQAREKLMNIRRLICTLISCLCLVANCSSGDILNPSHFTREYAEALRNAAPEVRVEIVRDLELKVISKEGSISRRFLYNAYDNYKLNPKKRNAIIFEHVTAGLQQSTSETIDEQRIIPVIKDAGWLESAKHSVRDIGEPDLPEYEILNDDLVIVYAEDSPKSIRFLGQSKVTKLKVPRSELKKLACNNLRRILPKMEHYSKAECYMITAGGDHETSLLLLDEIWSKDRIDVDGDFVVAIPARGLLFVTGTKHKEAIELLKGFSKKAYNDGPYRITPKLFVRRDGKFTRFEE
jgi:uncharacterized protein YtpQ (UPF0354 family)